MSRRFYIISERIVQAAIAAIFIALVSNFTLVTYFLRDYYVPSYKDSPDFLPAQIRTASLIVGESPRYGIDDAVDWESIFPKGHGFVRLPSDSDSTGYAYFAVSMYHQLHCLNSFRKMVVIASTGNFSQHNVDHAIHCLSYLRQLLLCHGDIALEPARFAETVKGGTTQAVYGEGTAHICNDWSQIRDWVERNYEEWKEYDKYEVSEGHT